MATPSTPKKRHRGTEPPKCELCGTRHWLREGHATSTAIAVVEERWPYLSLQTIDGATRMLAGVMDLGDIKAIRDQMELLRQYAQSAKLGLEAQNQAAMVKLVAERRYGEIRRASEKNRGTAGTIRGRDASGETIVVSPEDQTPRRADLGVSNAQDRRMQAESTVPEPAFKQYVAGTVEAKKELSSVGLVRIAKAAEREEKREVDRLRVAAAPPLAQIAAAGQRFQTIVIDPPWDWGDEGDADQFGRSRPTYATMPFEDVRAQPVGECAEANAHLYLWITNRSLPKGFELLAAWGFRYVTILTWCKPSIGMGNYFRNSTEQVLFGVKGSLPLLRRDVGTFFNAPRPTEHSEKPDAFYELIEGLSPGPWLDAFGRKNRPGWYVWGSHGAT